jgi:protein-S-isoprenylcysteine O-methyltransferase Ste14
MDHLRVLTLLNVIFYVANLLWILEFVFFRNKKRMGRFQEKKSFWFLIFAISFVIISTIQLSANDWGTINTTDLYPLFQILALCLYLIGLSLRYRGSKALGENFTRHVAVSTSMNLVSTGPYQYLRHPLYLGLFLITLGFPIYVGNWLALVVGLPLLFIGFSWRMKVEELALTKIHPSYAQWLKQRYRFVPFIY